MGLKKKIWLSALVVLLLIPAVAVLVVQIPYVQTKISQKVLSSLSRKIDGEISIGKVYYALPERIIVSDFSIKDENGETVAYAGRLSASIELASLIKNDELHINSAGIKEGEFNLVTLEDGTLNISKIFAPMSNDDEQESDSTSTAKIHLRRFYLEDFSFSLIDKSNPEYDAPDDSKAMNFSNLHISDINLDVRKVNFADGILSADIESLNAKESKGFNLHQLKGKVQYDEKGLRIDNLTIKDDYSDIEANYFSMGFDSPDAFSDFLRRVAFGIDMNNTVLDFRTLHHFSKGIDFLTLCLTLNGELTGPVANFQTDNLCVRTDSGETDLDFTAHISGLPKIDETMVGFTIRECLTSTGDIERIINQCSSQPLKKGTVSRYLHGEQVSFTGTLNGFFTDFVAFGKLDTQSSGTVDLDAVMRTDDIDQGYEILGNFSGKTIALGKIIGVENLGDLTFDGSIDGTTGKSGNNLNLDNLTVRHLDFNNYEYKDIVASGTLNDTKFDGQIISEDPNLTFDFHGEVGFPQNDGDALYKFSLNLKNADLYALHFDKREIAKITLSAEADFTRNKSNDFFGDFSIRDLKTQLDQSQTNIGDITISSLWADSNYELSVNSTLLTAEYNGTSTPSDFISEMTNLLVTNELTNLTGKPAVSIDKSHNYSFILNTLDLRPLCEFLLPGLYISEGTVVRSDFSKGNADVTLNSELVAYKNNFLKGLDVSLLNENDYTDAVINAESIQSGNLVSHDNAITAQLDDNGIDFQVNLMNNGDSTNFISIHSIAHFLDRTTSEDLISADILKSDVSFNNRKWQISPSSIQYRDKHLTVNDFVIGNGSQSLYVDGILSDSKTDTITAKMNEFDISIINPLLGNGITFNGKLSGEGSLIGYLGESKGLLLNFGGQELAFSGKDLGSILIESNWSERDKAFDFSFENKLLDERPIMLTGSFKPDTKYLNVNARVNKLDVSYFNPLAEGIVNDLSGSISTTVRAQGTLDNLKITSRNNRINNLGFTLDYTKVPYILDGTFSLTEDGFLLNDTSIKDRFGHSGKASGGILMNNLSDPQMNLALDLTDIQGLNTTSVDDDSFYGNAFASGTVSLNGPFSRLSIDINITPEDNSVIHIPLSSAGSQKSSILTFTNSLQSIESAYDSLVTLNSKRAQSSSDIYVHVKVNATPAAEINLDINEAMGDAIKARGNGLVDITVAPDVFDIKGDYNVSEGSYRLVLLGLASRDFNIEQGGTINFNGDIMQSDLNLTANYRTKASMSTLVPEMTARRNVDCNIGITGKLANPELSFTIDIPDLDPTTQSIVESMMNTEEKRLKQMLTLLISGGFMPDEQSGIVNNTTVLFSNASEIMSNQINNVFRQLEIPLDLGFNYQPGENGRDIFDVAVSTQLFNNRVTINGNIGNSQYLGASKNDIVGDVDMEIKLSKSGKIRLTLFSHSADQYSTYLDQSQRNGAGIAYQEEFDTFRELWQKLFWPKNKKTADPDVDQPVEAAEKRLMFVN